MRRDLYHLVSAVALVSTVTGCPGKLGGDGGNATRGQSSAVVPAAPQALGPGAASLNRPPQPRTPSTDYDDDPIFPFDDPPDADLFAPPPPGDPTEL